MSTFSRVEYIRDVDLPIVFGEINALQLLFGDVIKVRVDYGVRRRVARVTAQPAKPNRAGDRAVKSRSCILLRVPFKNLQIYEHRNNDILYIKR